MENQHHEARKKDHRARDIAICAAVIIVAGVVYYELKDSPSPEAHAQPSPTPSSTNLPEHNSASPVKQRTKTAECVVNNGTQDQACTPGQS